MALDLLTPTTSKTCTRCGLSGVQVEFSSYKRGDRVQVRSSCKDCNKKSLPHLLGVVSDKSLAEQTGTSRDMVAWHRRKLGIKLNSQGERIAA